jgi:hypothetical protein
MVPGLELPDLELPNLELALSVLPTARLPALVGEHFDDLALDQHLFRTYRIQGVMAEHP